MVRTRRIEQSDRIFFVTTNLQRFAKHFAAEEQTHFLEILKAHRQRGDFYLYGYVVMPDHVHLILTPRQKSLSLLMRDLKSRTGFEIAQRRNIAGPIWQPRFFDNIIRRVRHFWQKLEYVHQNPVVAGLVTRPEDWLWSSFRHYAKCGDVPVIPDPIDLPVDANALLWPAPWG